MNTDHLIKALTSDLTVSRSSIERRFAVILAPGVLLALFLFAITLGPRPDIVSASGDVRFIFKFRSEERRVGKECRL